jgi:hypothetical protein
MSQSLLDLFSRFHRDEPPSPGEEAVPRRPPSPPSANGDNGATAAQPPSASGGNGRDAHGRFTKEKTSEQQSAKRPRRRPSTAVIGAQGATLFPLLGLPRYPHRAVHSTGRVPARWR